MKTAKKVIMAIAAVPFLIGVLALGRIADLITGVEKGY